MEAAVTIKKKKKFPEPHAYVMLFLVICLAMVLKPSTAISVGGTSRATTAWASVISCAAMFTGSIAKWGVEE